MFRHLGISMDITMRTEEVIATLKRNRAEHVAIVKEAQSGYMDKLKQWLAATADKAVSWKSGDELFAIRPPSAPPESRAGVFDTAIHMLEAHEGDTIELSADAYRTLVHNEWDWSRSFMIEAVAYSELANEVSAR